MERFPRKIDMHIHTLASDGTDSPGELLEKVRAAGIGLFAVSDHDAVSTCTAMVPLLGPEDPLFINGVEFSCRDELGRYHVLGYAYGTEDSPLLKLVEHTHAKRMEKLKIRMDFLTEHFGFQFPREELDALWARPNPGKPHIGNLMVKLGYAPSKEVAIKEYINLAKTGPDSHIRPEEAIDAILGSGGVPVLAHPFYGDGGQLLDMPEMEERLRRLTGFGLKGMECYYSGFSPKLQHQALLLAERFDLYVSAGSDYHGKNKLVILGDTGLEDTADAPDALRALLEACVSRQYGES